MSDYWPVIIIAIIIVAALLWWLTSRGSALPDATPAETIEAPPVAATLAPRPEPTVTPDKIAVAPLIPDAAPASSSVIPKTATSAVAPPAAVADNLEMLKGLGPKVHLLLRSLGVTNFEQIANWTPSDVIEIDAQLGNFAGRIERDNWIDQAKLLSNGNIADFEKKYGALGSKT